MVVTSTTTGVFGTQLRKNSPFEANWYKFFMQRQYYWLEKNWQV